MNRSREIEEKVIQLDQNISKNKLLLKNFK